MDQEIIARLKSRINGEGLDAIVAVSPENVTYVSGFVVPSQSLMRWRHAASILTADGRIRSTHIHVKVSHGHLTLAGHAGHEADSAAALEDVASLTGVVDVTNRIEIR